MLNIFDLNYTSLSEKNSTELFSLRKDTFKDRLNWAVNCTNGMEFDQYDTQNTHYLFGVASDRIICSVRFIETKYPNMITGTFASYFNKIEVPEGNYIESSRFFVDKNRAREILKGKCPVTNILFLAMINYAIAYRYTGIYTIVSHPMLTILKRSGWQISVVEQGISEKGKYIYLVYLPTDIENQNLLIHRVNETNDFPERALRHWPMSIPLTVKQV